MKSAALLCGVLALARLAAGLVAGLPDPPALEPLPHGGILADRNGAPLRELPHSSDSRCLPVSFEAMAPAMRAAMVATEDRRFYRHPGVDWRAILRALFDNLRCGRIVSGASTIPWQIVRMAHPRPRTVLNKAREAIAALRLDAEYSKEELLTHYLNRAPFGGNLVGVEAAARAYFGKPAAALDQAEAALLAGLPQAPSRFRPDRHLDAALRRRRYVLERLRATGLLEPAAVRAAAAVPEITPTPRPFLAPHFCDLILARHPVRNRRAPLRTTLDLDMQRRAETLVADHAERLRADGIDGLALVLLDVRTGSVRALVGSPDYFRAPAGQVNAAIALRSPGSALKPFFYTEAFDRGLLTPDETLEDRPLRYREYRPENFDRDTRGSVRAREALAQSLNLPVLRLTERLELDRMVRTLRSLGLGADWRPPAHYGLPLALGAAEVRLLNLVNAYAVLARRGEFLPLRLREDAAIPPPRRIWLEASAWMTSDILRAAARGTLAQSGVAVDERSMPPLALKTGTSSGYRDAWCLAYNPEFAIGVWVGRTDGGAHPDLIGARVAAPIAAGLFQRLYPAGRGPWFPRPDGVKRRRVCARSGKLPGPACAACISADFLPGISSIAPCPDCRAGSAIPPEEAEPRIVAPSPGSRHAVLPGETHAVLSLRARGKGKRYWFVNDRALGAHPADRPLWRRLPPGRHRISCVTPAGRAAAVTITVDPPPRTKDGMEGS